MTKSCPPWKDRWFGVWSSSRVFALVQTGFLPLLPLLCTYRRAHVIFLGRFSCPFTTREVMRHQSASQKPCRLHLRHVHSSQASEEGRICQCTLTFTVPMNQHPSLRGLTSGKSCISWPSEHSEMDWGPRNLFGNDWSLTVTELITRLLQQPGASGYNRKVPLM